MGKKLLGVVIAKTPPIDKSSRIQTLDKVLKSPLMVKIKKLKPLKQQQIRELIKKKNVLSLVLDQTLIE